MPANKLEMIFLPGYCFHEVNSAFCTASNRSPVRILSMAACNMLTVACKVLQVNKSFYLIRAVDHTFALMLRKFSSKVVF